MVEEEVPINPRILINPRIPKDKGRGNVVWGEAILQAVLRLQR